MSIKSRKKYSLKELILLNSKGVLRENDLKGSGYSSKTIKRLTRLVEGLKNGFPFTARYIETSKSESDISKLIMAGIAQYTDNKNQIISITQSFGRLLQSSELKMSIL